MLGEAGFAARRATNQLDARAINVVTCPHLLGPADAAQLPADSILFNSEPLATEPLSAAYRELLARFHVWDYSHANLPHLPHARASVIPFGYCAALARMTGSTPGPADGLLFYGSLTPRRRRILDGLRAAGHRLDVVFGEYGAQLDVRLRRAAAVLNLHKTDDASTFEPLRCFYPLIQQIPVLSEETSDPTADPFRTAMTFAPLAELGAPLADRAALVARARRFAEVSALPAIRDAVARYSS